MPLTKRNLLSMLGLSGLGAALASCNTLSMFSTLTPKDADVKRIASNIAYGDNPRQTYDLYAPKNAPPGLPVLVFFYGGGWNSGSKDDYVWFGYALAALGYLVAIPDYRLVPEVVYPDFLKDNALAVKHVVAHAADHGGDAKRLGLIGHSAGGYAAVMLALDADYLGTDDYGQSPVKTCVGISGPYDFYPFDVRESIDTFGTWPDPMQTQPMFYARKTNTRFLLLQSRADKVVGLKNAVNLDAKLRATGTDVELKIYDGLSHQDTAAVFSVPFRKKAPLLADTQSFLKTAL